MAYISQITPLGSNTPLDIKAKALNVNSTDNAVVRFDGTTGIPQNSGVTIDDNNKVTATEFIGNLKANNVVPIVSKSFTSGKYGQDGSGTHYYETLGSITPNNFEQMWLLHYIISIEVTGDTTYTFRSDVEIYGVRNTYAAFKVFNSFYSKYPIYSHALLFGSSTSYPHEFGYRLASSYGDTTTFKNITVDIIEARNCIVSFFENLKAYTSSNPSNYTWRTFNATTNGLQETSDSDSSAYYVLTNGFRGFVGENKIYPYCLFARLPNGTYESFVLSSSYETSKSKNPHGFLPEAKIYYNSGSSTINTGAFGISAYEQYHLIDYRYSFNITTSSLPANCNTYLKWTYNASDGLLYLADTWLATTLPTEVDGFIYQRIGSNYYGSAEYRGSLLLNNPYYKYENGGIKLWYPSASANVSGVITTEEQTFAGDKTFSGNVTLSGETAADSLTIGNIQINGSANFINSPIAPTPAASSNDTKVATTEFVKSAIASGTAGAVAWNNITGKPSTFTPPLAANGTRGGIQIGYTSDNANRNYAVQLSSEKAYVNVPLVSKDNAGLAPKGAAVSSQNQTTKFLREDGTWAAPSYTVNTDNDTKVTQGATTTTSWRKVLLNGGSGNVQNDWNSDVTGVTDQVYQAKEISVQPSTGTLAAAKFQGDGSAITNLNASNIASGTLSADRLSTSGATAGSYGDNAAQTPGYGSTFKVPYITVDNKGRVTGISEHTVKIPASDNTDTNVLQTPATSTSNWRKILLSYQNNATESQAATSYTQPTYVDTSLAYQPSTGTLQTTTYKVTSNATITYNSSNGCLEIIT